VVHAPIQTKSPSYKQALAKQEDIDNNIKLTHPLAFIKWFKERLLNNNIVNHT
jgi:hypothetical protein